MDRDDALTIVALTDRAAELRDLETTHVRALSQVRALLGAVERELAVRTVTPKEDHE